MANNVENKKEERKTEVKPRKPNEMGSVSVQAHLRIFEPTTQKTYVEGRA